MTLHRSHRLACAAVASAALLVVTGCSGASTGVVAVHLTDAGCEPAGLALPAHPVTLRVSNDGAAGSVAVRREDGAEMARLADLGANRTMDLKIDLPTGFYSVECGRPEALSRLTIGTPSGRAVDLGSVAAADRPVLTGYGPADGNAYVATNLVASSAAYHPQIVNPALVDAWGLANRPAGAGGHIWVAANKTGTSLELIGDVGKVPLYEKDLSIISVPGARDPRPGAPVGATVQGQPTGVIFNTAAPSFAVDQGAIAAPAKFLFAGQDGTISAWTEQANPNGSTTQLAWATVVVDDSAAGSQYFGLAITPDGQRLLAADFGSSPGIKTFDTSFHPVPTQGFANPFLTGAPKPGSLVPWNVTTVGDKVFVSYATLGADDRDPQAPAPGSEEHAAGAGRVVEYDTHGTQVRILDDRGALDAPWGITTAPAGFGKLAGDLLVASFGDGTIAAFDANGTFVDVVRGPDGTPLVTPGIWALLPGNGASLGAADAVYFTAGPNAERDGVFGRLNAHR